MWDYKMYLTYYITTAHKSQYWEKIILKIYDNSITVIPLFATFNKPASSLYFPLFLEVMF